MPTKKYYLTTPLYYVNSKPHIGHSYTNIAADVLARFKRLEGNEVLFLTGTDEHGQKVDKAAQGAGLTPQEFTDRIAESFKELWKTLSISYDDFIRTTQPRHIQTVQKVWQDLYKKGEIYKDVYDGLYCTPCENFWLESQAIVEDGKLLCPDCRRPLERIKEENYFLKISKYQDWLIQTIKRSSEIQILPNMRKNEVLGFLENNKLQDLCISRPKNRLAWGIVSPLSENHVTYVWFDALINYISAVGYGVDEAKLKKMWPCDVHIIGKDILRHHAVYWTILLKMLELPLPKMIFAHGWWVQGGEKMSKSRGNVVDPVEIVKIYGVDPYRYFLLRQTSFGSDGTFSEEMLIQRFNTDLANDLGNLLHRTLTMCEKYFGGEPPSGMSGAIQNELKTHVNQLPSKLKKSIDELAFSEALEETWSLISQANKFIESKAPWTLAKEKKMEELKEVIVTLLEVLKITAQAVWPFMPGIGEAIFVQLGINQKISDVPFIDNSFGFFEKGSKVQKGAPLFPRIELKDSE